MEWFLYLAATTIKSKKTNFEIIIQSIMRYCKSTIKIKSI